MKKAIIILLLIWGCNPEAPAPKPKPQSYFIGKWEAKSPTAVKYILKDGDSGNVYLNGHWYPMEWKEDGQMLTLGWFGRSQKYWIYDQAKDSFNLCTIGPVCTAYYRQ